MYKVAFTVLTIGKKRSFDYLIDQVPKWLMCSSMMCGDDPAYEQHPDTDASKSICLEQAIRLHWVGIDDGSAHMCSLRSY
jgi:hypothetical protein